MLQHLLSQLQFVFLFRMVFSQSLNEGDQSTKEVKAVIGYLTESLSILELFFRSKRPKLVLIFSSNGTNPENAEMRSELQNSSFSRKDSYFCYIQFVTSTLYSLKRHHTWTHLGVEISEPRWGSFFKWITKRDYLIKWKLQNRTSTTW